MMHLSLNVMNGVSIVCGDVMRPVGGLTATPSERCYGYVFAEADIGVAGESLAEAKPQAGEHDFTPRVQQHQGCPQAYPPLR